MIMDLSYIFLAVFVVTILRDLQKANSGYKYRQRIRQMRRKRGLH